MFFVTNRKYHEKPKNEQLATSNEHFLDVVFPWNLLTIRQNIESNANLNLLGKFSKWINIQLCKWAFYWNVQIFRHSSESINIFPAVRVLQITDYSLFLIVLALFFVNFISVMSKYAKISELFWPLICLCTSEYVKRHSCHKEKRPNSQHIRVYWKKHGRQ